MKGFLKWLTDALIGVAIVVLLILTCTYRSMYKGLDEMYMQTYRDYLEYRVECETQKKQIETLEETITVLNNSLNKYEQNTKEESVPNLPVFGIPDDCVAFLYIPSCGIEAYIRYGSSMETISNGYVGQFECAQELGVGNYSILGHSNEEKHYVFSDLEPNIRIGDDIFVADREKSYRFKVDGVAVVNAEDTWVLEKSISPKLTIVCCTNNGTQRFVVSAILI